MIYCVDGINKDMDILPTREELEKQITELRIKGKKLQDELNVTKYETFYLMSLYIKHYKDQCPHTTKAVDCEVGGTRKWCVLCHQEIHQNK